MLTFLFWVDLSATVLLLSAMAADEVVRRGRRQHIRAPRIAADRLVSLSLARAKLRPIGPSRSGGEDKKAA
jgi:hypothetical protein